MVGDIVGVLLGSWVGVRVGSRVGLTLGRTVGATDIKKEKIFHSKATPYQLASQLV